MPRPCNGKTHNSSHEARLFQTLCHVRQNLFNRFCKAKAIEATELKLEFSGIRAMSYEFFRCGGVAHKMDSNFSMLGAMLK